MLDIMGRLWVFKRTVKSSETHIGVGGDFQLKLGAFDLPKICRTFSNNVWVRFCHKEKRIHFIISVLSANQQFQYKWSDEMDQSFHWLKPKRARESNNVQKPNATNVNCACHPEKEAKMCESRIQRHIFIVICIYRTVYSASFFILGERSLSEKWKASCVLWKRKYKGEE